MLTDLRTPRLTAHAICITLLLNSLSTSYATTICPAGFMPPDCAQQCKDGHYGANCVSPCPSSCLNRSCRPQNGECYKCIPGLTGSRCSEQCPKGFFGQDCKQPCPTGCQDNLCDPFVGACLQCLPGYSGTKCESLVPVPGSHAFKQPTDETTRTANKNSMLYMIMAAVLFSLPGCIWPCWVCYFKKKKQLSESSPKKHVYKPLNTDDGLQTNASAIKGNPESHLNFKDAREPKRGRGEKRKPSTRNSPSPPSKTTKNTFGYYSIRTRSSTGVHVESSFQNKDQLTDETLELGGFLKNFDHNKVLNEHRPLDVKKAANYTDNLYFKTSTKTASVASARSEKSDVQSINRDDHIPKSGSTRGAESKNNAGDNLSLLTRGGVIGQHPAQHTIAVQTIQCELELDETRGKQDSPEHPAHERRGTRQKRSFMTRVWGRFAKLTKRRSSKNDPEAIKTKDQATRTKQTATDNQATADQYTCVDEANDPVYNETTQPITRESSTQSKALDPRRFKRRSNRAQSFAKPTQTELGVESGVLSDSGCKEAEKTGSERELASVRQVSFSNPHSHASSHPSKPDGCESSGGIAQENDVSKQRNTNPEGKTLGISRQSASLPDYAVNYPQETSGKSLQNGRSSPVLQNTEPALTAHGDCRKEEQRLSHLASVKKVPGEAEGRKNPNKTFVVNSPQKLIKKYASRSMGDISTSGMSCGLNKPDPIHPEYKPYTMDPNLHEPIPVLLYPSQHYATLGGCSREAGQTFTVQQATRQQICYLNNYPVFPDIFLNEAMYRCNMFSSLHPTKPPAKDSNPPPRIPNLQGPNCNDDTSTASASISELGPTVSESRDVGTKIMGSQQKSKTREGHANRSKQRDSEDSTLLNNTVPDVFNDMIVTKHRPPIDKYHSLEVHKFLKSPNSPFVAPPPTVSPAMAYEQVRQQGDTRDEILHSLHQLREQHPDLFLNPKLGLEPGYLMNDPVSKQVFEPGQTVKHGDTDKKSELENLSQKLKYSECCKRSSRHRNVQPPGSQQTQRQCSDGRNQTMKPTGKQLKSVPENKDIDDDSFFNPLSSTAQKSLFGTYKKSSRKTKVDSGSSSLSSDSTWDSTDTSAKISEIARQAESYSKTVSQRHQTKSVAIKPVQKIVKPKPKVAAAPKLPSTPKPKIETNSKQKSNPPKKIQKVGKDKKPPPTSSSSEASSSEDDSSTEPVQRSPKPKTTNPADAKQNAKSPKKINLKVQAKPSPKVDKTPGHSPPKQSVTKPAKKEDVQKKEDKNSTRAKSPKEMNVKFEDKKGPRDAKTQQRSPDSKSTVTSANKTEVKKKAALIKILSPKTMSPNAALIKILSPKTMSPNAALIKILSPKTMSPNAALIKILSPKTMSPRQDTHKIKPESPKSQQQSTAMTAQTSKHIVKELQIVTEQTGAQTKKQNVAEKSQSPLQRNEYFPGQGDNVVVTDIIIAVHNQKNTPQSERSYISTVNQNLRSDCISTVRIVSPQVKQSELKTKSEIDSKIIMYQVNNKDARKEVDKRQGKSPNTVRVLLPQEKQAQHEKKKQKKSTSGLRESGKDTSRNKSSPLELFEADARSSAHPADGEVQQSLDYFVLCPVEQLPGGQVVDKQTRGEHLMSNATSFHYVLRSPQSLRTTPEMASKNSAHSTGRDWTCEPGMGMYPIPSLLEDVVKLDTVYSESSFSHVEERLILSDGNRVRSNISKPQSIIIDNRSCPIRYQAYGPGKESRCHSLPAQVFMVDPLSKNVPQGEGYKADAAHCPPGEAAQSRIFQLPNTAHGTKLNFYRRQGTENSEPQKDESTEQFKSVIDEDSDCFFDAMEHRDSYSYDKHMDTTCLSSGKHSIPFDQRRKNNSKSDPNDAKTKRPKTGQKKLNCAFRFASTQTAKDGASSANKPKEGVSSTNKHREGSTSGKKKPSCSEESSNNAQTKQAKKTLKTRGRKGLTEDTDVSAVYTTKHPKIEYTTKEQRDLLRGKEKHGLDYCTSNATRETLDFLQTSLDEMYLAPSYVLREHSGENIYMSRKYSRNVKSNPPEATSKAADRLYPTSKTADRLYPTSKTADRLYPTSKPADRLYPTSKTADRLYPTSKTADNLQVSSKADDRVYTACKADDRVYTACKADDCVYTACKADDRVYTACKADDRVYTASKADDRVFTTSKPDDRVYTACKPDDRVYTASKADDRVYTACKADDRVYTASKPDDREYTACKPDDHVYTTSKADDRVYTASKADDRVYTACKPDDRVYTASKPDDRVYTASKADDRVYTASKADDRVHTACTELDKTKATKRLHPDVFYDASWHS